MALKLSPYTWYEEVRAAEEYRDQFLDDWEDVLEGYYGPGYKPDAGPMQRRHNVENHAFEWLSLMVPQVTASKPRVRVKSERMGPARLGAKAQTFAVNRWIRQANMKGTAELHATDYGLKYCIGYVSPRPQPGMSNGSTPSRWPHYRRLSPRRYLQDPLAIEFEEQRWRSHLVIRDKEDLLKEAREYPERGWNVEAILGLPESQDIHKYRGYGQADSYNEYFVDRHEVSYWVIWAPEIQPDPKKGPDKGYNGALLFLGVGESYDDSVDDARWIRPPQPYYGPPWGPYQTSGAYIVPDDATPLSPIAGTKAQAEHLNAVARANQRAVEDYKRMALVSNADPDLEITVTEGRHGYVYTTNAEDLSKQVVQMELGGLTTQMLAAEDRARQSLDRNTGLPEAMRGNVEGGATATEVNAAMSGGSIRVQHHVDKFRDFQVSNLRTVSWYLEFDDTIQPFALGEDAARMLQDETGRPMEEVWYGPGLADGQRYEDFWDYDFEIELYSMERTSEQQAQMQAQELDYLVMQIGPAMLANPHVRWKEYLEKRGELRGIGDYGRLFDVDMALELGAQMMQMGMLQEPQPTGQNAQPRLMTDMAGPRPQASPFGGVSAGRERKSFGPSKMISGGSSTSAPATKEVQTA